MGAILGISAVVVLALLFLLFRSMGRLGQGVSAKERMRHNGTQEREPNPRATGLN